MELGGFPWPFSFARWQIKIRIISFCEIFCFCLCRVETIRDIFFFFFFFNWKSLLSLIHLCYKHFLYLNNILILRLFYSCQSKSQNQVMKWSNQSLSTWMTRKVWKTSRIWMTTWMTSTKWNKTIVERAPVVTILPNILVSIRYNCSVTSFI